MNVGQLLLLRYKSILRKGIVKFVHREDLDIKLLDGEIVQRKFWEVKKINIEDEERYKNVS